MCADGSDDFAFPLETPVATASASSFRLVAAPLSASATAVRRALGLGWAAMTAVTRVVANAVMSKGAIGAGLLIFGTPSS